MEAMGRDEVLLPRIYSRECQTWPEWDRTGSSSTAMNVMNHHTFTYVGNERWQSSGSMTFRWQNHEVLQHMSYVS